MATRLRFSHRAGRGTPIPVEAPAGNIGINIGVAAPMAISRSLDGRTVSSATCMGRDATP